MNPLRTAALLVLILAAAASPGAAASRQSRITLAHDLIQQARAKATTPRARALVDEAQALYDEALRQFELGRGMSGFDLLDTASITARRAIAEAEAERNEDAIASLRKRLRALNAKLDEKKHRLSLAVDRLERIKEQKTLALELLGTKAQNAIDEADEAIRGAMEMEAATYAPHLMAEARDALRRAEQELARGDFEAAARTARTAASSAHAAVEKASEMKRFQAKVLPRFASIYNVKAEPHTLGAVVKLYGVFSPVSGRISPDARPSLDAVLGVLAREQTMRLALHVHPSAAEEGGRTSRSAEELLSYFGSRGVTAGRFLEVTTTTGTHTASATVGSTTPDVEIVLIAPGATPESGTGEENQTGGGSAGTPSAQGGDAAPTPRAAATP